MKKSLLAIVFSPFLVFAQEVPKLTDEVAIKLSEKPLHCITQEYPNKTAHIINNESEVSLSPKVLHPSFYGCFDWHSSVHGHWMLVRLLKTKPGLSIAKETEKTLDQSFSKENLQTEADYFTKYQLTTTFERTYGWAWLLKLDEELTTWNHPKAKIWHQNLKPLSDKIWQPGKPIFQNRPIRTEQVFIPTVLLPWLSRWTGPGRPEIRNLKIS